MRVAQRSVRCRNLIVRLAVFGMRPMLGESEPESHLSRLTAMTNLTMLTTLTGEWSGWSPP